MKARLTFTFLILFVTFTVASDEIGNNTLTQNYLLHSSDKNRFHSINTLLNNPSMETFYNNYYQRPISYQNYKIHDLIGRLKNSHLIEDHRYPYGNQISIDPNVISRLVNHVPRANFLERIKEKQEQLGNVFTNYENSKNAYEKSYKAARTNTINSQIDSAITNNEKALYDSNLRVTPQHTYSTPFGEKDKNMNVILNQIREMEHKVKQPLPDMLPNKEEISAMNRLSEKLNEVSKRIHQRPLEELHQNAHAQDLMLERLSNLIRRMSNAVDDTRRDQFLNQLHAMIHKYHLHDEKFISNLENEIGYALANNVPLQMPRDTQAALNQHANLSETDKAKVVSQNMEDYGKTLLNRSRELKHRADILERRTTVPYAEREELLDHIRNRLISPPAEVHAIGAQRPAYQYKV